MALDTAYRPRTYRDLLGQEEMVAVLRQFVLTGAGFHQSYLFAGGWGTGKTTSARILARALLCDSPVGGEACDKCPTCISMLTKGTADCFTEFDAATNSGVDAIGQLTENLQYDTFSGKRRVFLMDEAHRLSKASLDRLLLPLEDCVPGSQDKKMVCLFCTTEPEKMRNTIFSRCAPAFLIRKVQPEKIADRLEYVCNQEGIPYEREALVLIAAATELHIRDALKALEGVSMLNGGASMANTTSYLRLNTNPMYLSILGSLTQPEGLPVILAELDKLAELVSPTTAYEKLSELSVLAFSAYTAGRKVPVFWPADQVRSIGEQLQGFCLQVSSMLSSRPGHPSYAMLSCDLATLFYQRAGVGLPIQTQQTVLPLVQQVSVPQQTPITAQISTDTKDSVGSVTTAPLPTVVPPTPVIPPVSQKPFTNGNGVYIDPRVVNVKSESSTQISKRSVPALPASEFRQHLVRMVAELDASENR